MSFHTLEIGVETSRPREFYRITHGNTVYLAASGDRDVIYLNETYPATPIARTDLQIDRLTAEIDIVLVLPVTHPLVARYLAQLTPPRQVQVTIWRMQLGDGSVEQICDGLVTSMALEDTHAKFALPSRIRRALERKLPSVLVDSACAAILYDPWCGVDRSAFEITSECSYVDGRDVHFNTVTGHPDQWFRFGEITHVASGEKQTIFDHVGLKLQMQSWIPELKVGDAIKLAPGCEHDPATCNSKYDNMLNFVGLPNRPTRNPFFPTGLGIGETG